MSSFQGGRPQESGVVDRVAARSLARREAGPPPRERYAEEIRRLLDAALTIIGIQGSASRARVADIVAEAGLSNDAFYRHFPSKSSLVMALIEDGIERLAGYLEHQMAKESTPEAQVQCWVRGVLRQAEQQNAAAALAVLSYADGLDTELAVGGVDPRLVVALLLHTPLRSLGSADPDLDAALMTHAVFGIVADHLRSGSSPVRREIDHVTRFCLAAAGVT